MRTTNSIGNRLIALTICIIMVLGMFPTGVVIATEPSVFGVVESLCGDMTITETDGEVNATYAGSLNWVPANPSIGRHSDGWWVGILVTAPETLNLEKATYISGGTVKSFKDCRDSTDASETQYIQLWGLVTEEYLKQANLTDGLSTYSYKFDWDGNGEYEQTVLLNVDADETILLDTQGEQVYPAADLGYGVVDLLTPGATITGNESANISVAIDNEIVIDWVAADPSIGRYQDGWWAGIKITVPEGMTREQVENAQYMSGTVRKSFWTYKDSQDDADVHFLTMWIPLNGLLTDSMAPYVYQFDWNNDGLYDQKIVWTVDGSKVVLNKDGKQMYPTLLGNVYTYTGGTVEDNGTADVTVVVDQTTLNWSTANGMDAWWVGIKMEAPEGMTVEALQAVNYQTKSGPDAEWSAEKSFWNNKDSADTAQTHFIQLWFAITPEALERFQGYGRNITMWYQFDWNDDGTYEQMVTFSVDPYGDITLNKKDQTDFGFTEEAPADIWVGDETYQNVATGGQGDGEITYEIIAGDAATVDPQTGVVTFTSVGTVTVKATKAGDSAGFYEEISATYNITAVKKSQEPKFTTSNPTITYAPNTIYTNAITEVMGGTVTYKIINEDINGAGVAQINEETGELTVLMAGTVTVQAAISGDGAYEPATAEYTLVIERANQPELVFVNPPLELTWQEATIPALVVEENLCTGKLVWEITEGNDVAEVDENGVLTLLKAGTFTLQVKKEGDNCYNESAWTSVTILVNRAEQSEFGFGDTESVTVVYNDNDNQYTLIATGGQSSSEIKYIIYSGDAATVDDNGVVTLIKAGTVVIQATRPEDDRYKAISDTYTLIIEPDTQEFTFEQGAEVEITYGALEYINPVVFGGEYSEKSAMTYTISENEIGASIDPATGKITFADSEAKVGTVTVTATKAEDECYIGYSTSYTLTVSYLETTAMPTPDGDKLNDSGWFTGNVVIKAPEGYTISYANELSTADWSESVRFESEGADRATTVYLKDAQGYITDKIEIGGIYTDTGNPVELAISYEKPMLEILTFGIYQAETLEVTISAADTNSGIASLTYNFGAGDVVVNMDGAASAEYTFTINAQYRDKIKLIATDVAGRSTELVDGIVLVLDTKEPEITAGYDFTSGQHREHNGIFYTQNDTNIVFTIAENNFDLSDKPVVAVNNTEQTVVWSQVDGTNQWQSELLLSGNGDYVVDVTFTDVATNEMVAFKQEIHIDDVPPVIDVIYTNSDVKNEYYYNADQEAVITITEHNFLAKDVVVVVTAKDILGNDVQVMDYATYATDDANWMHEGDVHTLKLPFTVDARYTLSVNYTALAGCQAVGYEDMFVVDHTDAANIQITYSTPVAQKLLELVTFGIYQANVEVTVTAEDVTSGVDYFLLTYTKATGSSSVNEETWTQKLEAVQSKDDAKIFTASYVMDPQADGAFSVEVFDMATNDSSASNDTRVVVDDKRPELTVKYEYASGTHREENNHFYTQSDVTVSFFVKEANFSLAEPPVVTVNGTAKTVEWTATGTEDEWKGQIKLTGNGDYKVEVAYKDAATNEMAAYEQMVHIDNNDPTIQVVYDNNKFKNQNCFDSVREATVTITEHNFHAEDVKLKVTATNIKGQKVTVMDYAAYAADPKNWDSVGDNHVLKLDFNIDAIYEITLDYTDLAGNAAVQYETEFVIDRVSADDITITYSSPVIQTVIEQLTFGFYQADVVITVSADDAVSGVDRFELTYTRDENASDAHAESIVQTLDARQRGTNSGSFSASYTLDAQARGSISVKVYDRAGNDSAASDRDTVIVTDTISPDIEVSYETIGADTFVGFRDETGATVDNFADAANAYYNGSVVATITVHEANFFEGKSAGTYDNEVVHEILIKVTKTDDNGNVTVTEYLCENAGQLAPGAEYKYITWSSVGDIHTTEIEFANDGDYVLEISYVDFSGNNATIEGDDGNDGIIDYTSKVITIDETAPVIEITYDNNSALNGNCYSADRVATIKVTEHNFMAEEFVATVTAKNILGENVTVYDHAACAANDDNWTHEGNVHTLKLPFREDAIYTFDVAYTDLAGNEAADFAEQSFIVDHTSAGNIRITYSVPVIQTIIEKLTFGFYKAEAVITVTAEDMTSGVDYFELTYTRDQNATGVHTDDFMQTLVPVQGESNVFTASYILPAEARGSFSVKVFDKAGNTSFSADKTNVIVTDTVSPEIEVNYAAKDADTAVHFVDNKVKDVGSFEEAYNVFYNGNVVVTITVNEANFFEGKQSGNNDVVSEFFIKVTKTDDNGKATVIEYLPAKADKQSQSSVAKEIVWSSNGDIHTASIEFADEGDYVLEITYTDFSRNDAALAGNDGVSATKTYTSKIITVDKTAPVFNVTYENTNVLNTIDDRAYYDKVQSAVITVTEHNFRAQDVAAVVTAKNVLAENVAVADFAAQLADESNWSHNGNVHTAKVVYSVDANYTFDIACLDLAKNASVDYKQDLFTVDTTAPTGLTVSYSTNVFEEILQSITFGYYNATMTVTISAEDETTGIYHFAYSYINSENVSEVNAELLDQAIRSAEITYEGKRATATFSIPKLILDGDNQFNGTVEFTAFDRSENETLLQDSTRIIVDNISPTAKISYSKPVQSVNDISYYDGNIDVSIVIDEANFYSEDVVVTVTKDGVDYPVTVAWSDNSVDSHTGTFTLTEDGDYFVHVQYKDKSGNQMADYVSNELTLDTTVPVIHVSNIVANSANKDAEYGFVIEVSDINLDMTSVKPVLKAVMKNAEGQYEIVEIDLGEATVVVDGQTCTYTVENLPNDALYTMTCEAADMSGNMTEQITLEDSKMYEQVQFSINRNGSTFGYGDSFTEELVGQYYVYSVRNDVVVVEVNVDPIENYKVTLNGVELVEGTDYTTVQTSNEGEWSKRTYTISKDLFAEEGEYSIIVSSVDKADTTAFSDVKNLSLSLVVDQTAPVLTITGMETGGRYQTDEQIVTMIPSDEGGRLNSLYVVVLDAEGKPATDDNGNDISVRFDMAGEELIKYLEENDNKIVFSIPTGLNNQVKVICTDCAVGAENLPNEYNELFERVTVSSNSLVIFYAYKPLFYGSIAGVVAIAILIAVLLKRKKKAAAAKSEKAK